MIYYALVAVKASVRSLTAKGRKEETKMRGGSRAAARVHETENTCGASRKGAPNEPDPADAGVDP